VELRPDRRSKTASGDLRHGMARRLKKTSGQEERPERGGPQQLPLKTPTTEKSPGKRRAREKETWVGSRKNAPLSSNLTLEPRPEKGRNKYKKTVREPDLPVKAHQGVAKPGGGGSWGRKTKIGDRCAQSDRFLPRDCRTRREGGERKLCSRTSARFRRQVARTKQRGCVDTAKGGRTLNLHKQGGRSGRTEKSGGGGTKGRGREGRSHLGEGVEKGYKR